MVHIYGSLESAKHHMSTSELVLTLTMSDCNIFTIFSHKPSLSIHYPQLYLQLASHMYAKIVQKLGFKFVQCEVLICISSVVTNHQHMHGCTHPFIFGEQATALNLELRYLNLHFVAHLQQVQNIIF